MQLAGVSQRTAQTPQRSKRAASGRGHGMAGLQRTARGERQAPRVARALKQPGAWKPGGPGPRRGRGRGRGRGGAGEGGAPPLRCGFPGARASLLSAAGR